MAKASVELLDHSSQQLRRQPANEAGQYTFAGVLPGSYRVSASAAGFRQAAVPSLNVDVAKSYTLNFALELGAISETVEVEAGAPGGWQQLHSPARARSQGAPPH